MSLPHKKFFFRLPPISTKQTIISLLNRKPPNTKTTMYGIGNPGPGLGQAQKCDGVKPVNPPLLITGSLTSIHQYIYKCPHAHSNQDLFHGRFIKLCKLLFDI
jgi:hypothetical protein